jgi:hypothetical protein
MRPNVDRTQHVPHRWVAWHPSPCEAEPSASPGLSSLRTVRADGGAFTRLQRAPFYTLRPFAPTSPAAPVEDLDSDTDQGTLRFLYLRQNLFD